MKVYEAIAIALRAQGHDTVFGLMGDGNMGVWGALDRFPDVTILASRHEAAAITMAEGYATATGRTALATVTCGPGLTHSATSLITAARGRIPMVIFVGDIPARETHNVQRMDQRRFVEACEARFHNLSAPENLARELREAFRVAWEEKCPVVFNALLDIQDQEIGDSFTYQPYLPVHPTAITASVTDLELIANALTQAERPVFIAGRGAVTSGAIAAIAALADASGALVGTTLPAKGAFAGHPFDIGVCGGMSSQVSEELLLEADLVVAFGASLGHFTRGEGRLFNNAAIFVIDTDETRSPPLAGSTIIHADARGVAESLLQRLVPDADRLRYGTSAVAARLADGDLQVDRPVPNDGLDSRRLSRNLSAVLPDDAQIVLGIGHFWSFPALYLAFAPPARMYFTYAFGAIGSALPLGLGVKFSRPDNPCIVIEGDGSLLQNLQELETAAKAGVPLTVIVMNDQGYGAEMYKLAHKGYEAQLAQWESIDLVAVARACGGDGICLRSEDEMAEAMLAARRAGGLFLIDCRISPTSPSDLYERNSFKLGNRTPLLRKQPRPVSDAAER